MLVEKKLFTAKEKICNVQTVVFIVYTTLFFILAFKSLTKLWKVPITPVWNIPQVNKFFVKKCIMIGYERGILKRPK